MRLRFALAVALAAAPPGLARAADADAHAGHVMASEPADPHAGHVMAPEPADPHAGHVMPTPSDPHAGHVMAPQPADPHAGHVMPTPAEPSMPMPMDHAGQMAEPAGASMPMDHGDHAGHAPPEAAPAPAMTGADLPVGNAPAPGPPAAALADARYGAEVMDRARAQLRREHGGARIATVMIDTLEVRPASHGDYAWEGSFRYGGDVNHLVVATEGEGEIDGRLEQAEVHALLGHAIGPYFDLRGGLRQDLQPGARRTYAALGVAGLAPYWFEVEATAFLSDKGDVLARLEGAYDLRLTQRLILEPRVEVNLSAADAPEIGLGAGLTDAEAGLRLRYEIRREFAPYVGVNYERRFGGTADLARAAGERAGRLRVVAGLRAWF